MPWRRSTRNIAWCSCLRDIEEFSTRETADILGISVEAVKVRLLRARLMLRERLTRLFGDESTRVKPHDHSEASEAGRPEGN